MKKNVILVLIVASLLLLGCHKEPPIDPMLRSRVDGLNREAFLCRYRNPKLCIDLSEQALRYIADSLPQYADGLLRAHNNMAFAYYQMSDHAMAYQMLDRVDNTLAQPRPAMQNSEIEKVIAQLLRARLLQRDCRIADSYRLLNDIDRKHTLQRSKDNLLYNYAQIEYYITTLVLNFHYRQGQQADVRTLIEEVERRRSELKVDYAQDMALNYALAYGWQSAGESLIALDYCEANFRLLSLNPSTYDLFHYANTLQMTALALKSMPGTVPPDSVLALYDEARLAFFEYGDPYQMLGGTTSTARYALLIGDTAFAHEVLNDWRSLKGMWQPFTAPKMEVGYFDLLIRSRLASSPDQARVWYEHRSDLQERITQNEKEDFVLQQTLRSALRRSHWTSRTAIVLAIMSLLMLVLLLMLWHNTRRLHREKRRLEEAKRRDVERIANVETCLSVLRHDVSPFMGYLSNPNLSPELRDEVTAQLLRTFDNIKNWTRLSIPTGLAFKASIFLLQEVLDDVQAQVVRPHAGVVLHFEPTSLSLFGDKLLVTILLRNLLNNALQHTTEGSITISATSDADRMVEISIADTGSGMSQEQVESLFRADREVQGEHGFGLILCRYIIKKHDDLTRRGCRIWVNSIQGVGTTIHVRLAAPDER